MSPNPEHHVFSAQCYTCHSTCPLTLPTGLINNLSGQPKQWQWCHHQPTGQPLPNPVQCLLCKTQRLRCCPQHGRPHSNLSGFRYENIRAFSALSKQQKMAENILNGGWDLKVQVFWSRFNKKKSEWQMFRVAAWHKTFDLSQSKYRQMRSSHRAYKQTKKQTNLKLPSLHLHSTGFLHCFLHTNPELVYRLWDRSIWSAVSLDEVTVPCYYGAQGRLFFPNVYGTRRS